MSKQHRKKACDLYRTTRVATASPEQLILMLYERAISGLDHAAKDPRLGRQELVRAQAIVGELSASLDAGPAPELAGHLASLYVFAQERIGEALADATRTQAIQEARDVLATLLQGFEEAWKGSPAR